MPTNEFIKAEKVVRTSLGLLEREIVLPRLVWRDAGGDFKGAKGDTITIRLPAFGSSRRRTLRAGTPIQLDTLVETTVDVTLTTDVYRGVPITDEQMTLDIQDFGAQVLAPNVSAVARGLEDELIDTMVTADYEVGLELDTDSPYDTLVDARKVLSDHRVPMNDRFFACGSSVEAAMLKSDLIKRADQSGDDSALRDAVINRLAGFTIVSVPGLPPNVAIAGHRSAFVMSLKAPAVPAGVTWGASQSHAGLAMRAIRDYDFENTQDRLLVDSFVGTNVVKDHGDFNSEGQFVPATEPDTEHGTDLKLVRAVMIELVES